MSVRCALGPGSERSGPSPGACLTVAEAAATRARPVDRSRPAWVQPRRSACCRRRDLPEPRSPPSWREATAETWHATRARNSPALGPPRRSDRLTLAGPVDYLSRNLSEGIGQPSRRASQAAGSPRPAVTCGHAAVRRTPELNGATFTRSLTRESRRQSTRRTYRPLIFRCTTESHSASLLSSLFYSARHW